MRDYAKVGPQFWIGQTGKALRKKGTEAVLVGAYLMTAPGSNMLGLYYLPLVTLAHETGLGMEGASKGLRWAIEAGFCAYDEEAEVVWVYEMAAYQIAPSLKRDDKRCAGIQNDYNSLPECQHLSAFYEKYSLTFNMTFCRESAGPLQAPCKPLRSQEQEQEQEQDKEQEHIKSHVGASAPGAVGEQAEILEALPGDDMPANPIVKKQSASRSDAADGVRDVFTYWQQSMGHPHAKLDAKREKSIKARIKDGYTVGQLCQAVDGCKLSPHHMGQNDTRTIYDDIELICRDGSRVDKFIKLSQALPSNGRTSNQQQTIDALNRYMQRGGHAN